ncbi:SCO family protein [Metabacillus malikii]|uniref:Protein SCO1/2 n=1 Tax=Metabacillus malikii TaxID=1504265 RepID=A0ABT9ZFB5_9BACI|nr:SCO family protein [Metabacillus malikii]MDQ0230670.1 protein SCO1/2 [Metabacillus malikii]
MKKIAYIVFVAVLGLVGCSQSINLEEHFSLNGTVEELEAVNQDGEAVNLIDEYENKVWLAAFIFTNCDTVCSPMTFNMTGLQKEMNEKKVDAELVSFSIDPEYDTPEVLKQFAQSFHVDEGNWNFLTGYDQETIELFANKSFLAPAAKLEDSNQFIHSTEIFLMKGTKILEKYDVAAEVNTEKIIEDIKLLQ